MVPRMFLTVIVLLAGLSPAWASGPDDVTVRTSVMRINQVKLAGQEMDVDFVRSTVDVDLGFGPATVGLSFQNANRPADAAAGTVENGLMLTAGYNWILSDRWRLDTHTRIGLVDTDPANPLYATDTDLRANLVRFSPDGAWTWAGRNVHPSAYIGGIVNRYGRVQSVAGMGLWWNGWGSYVTGFASVNGIDNPMVPGDHADEGFAYLQDRGVSVSGTYDLGSLRVGMRRNFALENGGNDLVFVLEWNQGLGGGWR